MDKKLVSSSKFENWRYVRTKIVAFVPYKAKQCSLDELPDPPGSKFSDVKLNSFSGKLFASHTLRRPDKILFGFHILKSPQ